MCDQQRLRSAYAYAQSDQSICKSLEYSMTVKLLTKHHLEFLSLRGGCTVSPESNHIKCLIVGTQVISYMPEEPFSLVTATKILNSALSRYWLSIVRFLFGYAINGQSDLLSRAQERKREEMDTILRSLSDIRTYKRQK